MGTYELKEPPITVQAVEALAPLSAGSATTIARGDFGHPQTSDNVQRTVTRPVTDALASMRRELDTYWNCMRGFASMEPDAVLIALSAYTARVGEMRKNCFRDGGRHATRLRLDELEPLLDECDRQFKFHSRLQSIRELDWRMTGGAPS